MVPYLFKCLGLYLCLFRLVHETKLPATDIMAALDLLKPVGHFLHDYSFLNFYGFPCVFGFLLLVELSDPLLELAQHIDKRLILLIIVPTIFISPRKYIFLLVVRFFREIIAHLVFCLCNFNFVQVLKTSAFFEHPIFINVPPGFILPGYTHYWATYFHGLKVQFVIR